MCEIPAKRTKWHKKCLEKKNWHEFLICTQKEIGGKKHSKLKVGNMNILPTQIY